MKKTCLFVLLLIACTDVFSQAQPAAHASVLDSCLLDPRYNNGPGNPVQGLILNKWNRDVTNRVILLVDWEGYMGNPEALYRIVPPSGAQYPVTATISVSGAPLLYFSC